MNRKQMLLALSAALAFGSAATLVVEHVRAAGIPTTGALTYSGLLQDGAAAPLTGATHTLEVKLWSASTAGTLLCDTGSPTGPTTLDGGRFSILLPDTCTTAIGTNPSAYSEVLLDGTSLGRSKLGAVPYAVEANHAVSTDSASGALDTRIKTLETRLGVTSAFRVHLSTNNIAQVPDQTPPTPLLFDVTPDYDLNGEVTNDATKTTFSPKSAGYYVLACTPIFESGAPGAATGWGAAYILVNATAVANNGYYGDLWTATRRVEVVTHLNALDKVTCGADQQASGAARTVRSGSSFEGMRLAL
ncbi:MAG TPA: hypothetical protein VGM29_16710 [Polyangiaceae bacterium]|jgi:hypothetical protein